MEVFVINGILAAILMYLLIKKVRKDNENKPGRWNGPPED